MPSTRLKNCQKSLSVVITGGFYVSTTPARTSAAVAEREDPVYASNVREQRSSFEVRDPADAKYLRSEATASAR